MAPVAVGAARRIRRPLQRAGLTRSAVIRRVAQVGHPRLRALRAHAMRGDGARARLLRGAFEQLERGTISVPQGHAAGLRFHLRHLTLAHAHLGGIAYGVLETSVQEALVRHLGPGGVLYDVGANLGFFALLGARLAGPDGHVYALEPAPENAQAIRDHAALNRIENLTVLELAAGAAAGRARLQIVDDRSWSKLEGYGAHPGTERVVEVDVTAIDDLVRDGALRPPTLIKIDVEGAELDVLAGLRETLARHRPAIVCELHGTHAAFAAAMAAHGYRVINLEGTAPIQAAPESEHALALPALDPGD